MNKLSQTQSLESNFIEANKILIPKIDSKIFYAPELSQDLLVNYLARKHNSNAKQLFNNFDLSILFRNAVSNSKPTILSHQLNDWTVNGFIRYVNENTIALPLVLSTNRILEITKQGRDNKYAIELAALRYLYNKKHNEDVNLAVIAIDRLFTNYKAMPTKLLNFIEITDTYSDDEIEQMLIQRTTELDKHLNSNTLPQICSNLRWHRKNGKSVPMQCKHYCNYSHVCKHTKTTDHIKISKNSIIF